jgi:hypothetical protein
LRLPDGTFGLLRSLICERTGAFYDDGKEELLLNKLAGLVMERGFDSFLDYYDGAPAMWAPGKGWTQDRYMPRLAKFAGNLAAIPFDFHELIAALAPRPIWINAPLRDSNFRYRSVDAIVTAARGVYALHGAERNLTVHHPDCPHEFPREMREQAYAAIDAALR